MSAPLDPHTDINEVGDFIRTLRALADSIGAKAFQDEDELTAAIVEAWKVLRGDFNSVPWAERRDALHRLMPEVPAWCVVVDRTPGFSVWPGMAFIVKANADAWCDFLSDFYYDVHVKDGTTTWKVERRLTTPYNVAFHPDGEKVGTGYFDRSRWDGTLPMTRWQRSTGSASGWVRVGR
jgi:hypothetical protein